MFYKSYQTKENQEKCPREWTNGEIPDTAFHVGVFELSHTPPFPTDTTVNYSGDFVIDVDHKPTEETQQLPAKAGRLVS